MSSVRVTPALCAVQVLDVMGVTVIVSALPRMLSELGGTPAEAGLVVPVYAVGFASLLLLSARLGDRYGHRRLLLVGLAVFAAGSVVAALAPGVATLIAARGAQGVAAAISVPNALVLLTGLADDDADRQRTLGAWNACGGLGGALGLVIGGVVTTTLGWRSIFWANGVVAVLLILALARLLPAPVPDGGMAEGRRDTHLPMFSAVLQVVSIGAVVAAANAAERSLVASLTVLALAGVTAAVLVWREHGSRQPLVPATLWTRPGFLAGLAGSFGVTASTSTFIIVATLYLQSSRGFSAAAAGLLILPFSVTVILAAAITGRIIGKLGAPAMLLLGLVVISASTLLVIGWPSTSTVVVAITSNGLGNGTAAVAAYTLGTAVSPDHHGAAAGLLNTAAQIGTAVVVALAVAIASRPDHSIDHRAGWITAAGAAVLVIGVVWVLTRRETGAGHAERTRQLTRHG